jgi:uncharacterized delta-60 repeat protein
VITLFDVSQPSDADAKAMAVQSDGKILVAGIGSDGGPSPTNHFRLVRLNADGSRDATYGPLPGGGVKSQTAYSALISAMALQPDGRAVVVGRQGAVTGGGNLMDFALARFLGSSASPSPVQVGSFAASAAAVAAGSPLTLTAGGITTTNAGATITQVAFYAVNSSGIEQYLGYGTANAGGTWTLTFTVNLAPGTYTLLALAADSTGAVSDPFALALNVT